VVPWETERELGSDAFALRQWDAAVLHYTRAIDLRPTDAALWSNRAAAFLAKQWCAAGNAVWKSPPPSIPPPRSR
jgi:hypothetical protein